MILPYILYTVGYLNEVLCSYESVGVNVQAKHKNRSTWPIFHGSIVLPYIFKSMLCMGIMLLMSQSALITLRTIT